MMSVMPMKRCIIIKKMLVADPRKNIMQQDDQRLLRNIIYLQYQGQNTNDQSPSQQRDFYHLLCVPWMILCVEVVITCLMNQWNCHANMIAIHAALTSEKKQRLLSKELVSTDIRAKAAPFTFALKKGVKGV